MAVRLITYDLSKEPDSEDYQGLLEVIRKHAWARLSESSYAIVSDETPSTIYKKLIPFIDENDSLLVLTLELPYQGQHSKEVVDWLAKAF